MKTDNELIAEFMGFKPAISVNCYYVPDDFKYIQNSATIWKNTVKFNTSWDWLMPVVEKIDRLYSEAFPPGPEFVRRIMAQERLSEIIDSHYMDVIALPLGTPIKECYENIIKFIKWYNQQKP